ncbi:Sugar or nucleoside kinase, ribokinase family [Natronobacterium gregoryi]|uniref:Fructokinase n=2 Tax=Natronobacterium gregoryi TaxID=44930 RepID=L9YJM5_NATGS|nr:Fructokinase [Natronobacterium gregoryi SP2]SFJ37492.1 Sugar or nucleoside kinase, ribokinase family [Natronobacterium gregoryi]
MGDDPFGRYLLETLEEYGLPDRCLETDPTAKTGLAFVTHDETGDREFTFYRDGTADTRLEPGRIDDETLATVGVQKTTVRELERLGFVGDFLEAIARDAMVAGPAVAFVTRGDAGAIAVGADGSEWAGVAIHPGFDTDVVDTTGAGDAFVAGAIAGLYEGRALESTLAFANAVGAVATTAAGAMAALPDRKAVASITSEFD